MISIAEAISDLLFVRDTLVVPGLGAFQKKPCSAKVNPVANYFTTPSCLLEFDPGLREDNDLVVHYMAEKNEIPEEEARRLLAMFVSDCFNSLKAGKKVVLKDVGTLYYDWAGDLAFEPSNTINYNADAFGLCDFSPTPIDRSKSKDEIKAEIAQQQKDKNTPVTVDEKAVHEEEEGRENRHGWLWILLAALLLAGLCFALFYFRIIDFGKRKPANTVITPEMHAPKTYSAPVYVPLWERVTEMVQDTTATATAADTLAVNSEGEEANQPETKPVLEQKTQPSEEIQTPNIRIIAGCFAQEDNAERLAASLRSKGYTQAFVEKRKTKWFVAFGRYSSDEEAMEALREIRKADEYKAWILKE